MLINRFNVYKEWNEIIYEKSSWISGCLNVSAMVVDSIPTVVCGFYYHILGTQKIRLKVYEGACS